MNQKESKAFLAELVGTFILVEVTAGSFVLQKVSNGDLSYVAKLLSPGLVVLTLIYAIGNVSGAHLNPVISFGFALRGVFPWRRLPLYWLAQFLGGFLAAWLLWALFGETAHVGSSLPQAGTIPALIFEAMLTFFLVFIILSVVQGSKIIGPNAGLAIGFTVAFDGLFGAPVSGASMNPARSLGPAILGHQMTTVWIYFLGPFLGTALAVGLAYLIQGNPTKHAEKVAPGTKAPQSLR